MLIRKPTDYGILLDPLLSPAAALKWSHCLAALQTESSLRLVVPCVQALAALGSGSVGLQSGLQTPAFLLPIRPDKESGFVGVISPT